MLRSGSRDSSALRHREEHQQAKVVLADEKTLSGTLLPSLDFLDCFMSSGLPNYLQIVFCVLPGIYYCGISLCVIIPVKQ